MYVLTKKTDDALLPMVVKRDGSFQLAWSRSLFKLQDRYAHVADKVVIEVNREDFDNLNDKLQTANRMLDFVDLQDGAMGTLKAPIAIHPKYGEPSFRIVGHDPCGCDCDCSCDCDY